MDKESIKKYLVEFIGTYFLIFTIGCVVIGSSSGELGPIAIGSVLTALIFAGGHISGAHYNPAVTIAFWLNGKCERKDIMPYIFAQLSAAFLAAYTVLFFRQGSEVYPMELDTGRAIVAEVLFTFALVYVILNVALAERLKGNSFYGLAIGLIVLGGIYSVGDISGAVFNPAVAFGITTMGISVISNIWIYLLANLAGGISAALIYKCIE